MDFDITAPIERQFTRGGQKVLAIYDSGLNCTFPIAAWTDGEIDSKSFTKDGYCWSKYGKNNSDIITRPEPLPLIVSFQNVYPKTVFVQNIGYTTFEKCEGVRQHEAIATVKTTFDPNTGESSAETVWQKEAK